MFTKFCPFWFEKLALKHLSFSNKNINFFRNRQGRNDNPSAIEFSSAFRKLLVCHPLITSVDHNVLTNSTGILTATSSCRKRLPIQSSSIQCEWEIDYEGIMMNETETMDAYDQHMVAYAALCSEERVLQKLNSNKNQCSECANILLSVHDKINDELLAMKKTTNTEAKQPCLSTVNIIIFSNAVMKCMPPSMFQSTKENFDNVWKIIYNNINHEELYIFADFQHQQKETICNHKEDFIIRMIKAYMTLKAKKIGRKITDEQRGELIRNRRKHAIHEAGQ